MEQVWFSQFSTKNKCDCSYFSVFSSTNCKGILFAIKLAYENQSSLHAKKANLSIFL